MSATRTINNLFAMARRKKELLVCQHAARLSVDDYGTPQYGTPTPFEAMWIAERQRIVNERGEEQLSRGKLWVPSQYVMMEGDQITLPDGTQPPILAVRSDGHGQGFTHFEVFF